MKKFDNVFEALGFEDEVSASLKMRAEIYCDVLNILEREYQGKTQMEIANILGSSTSRVSELKNGKFQKFTVEKLLEYACKLDPNTEYFIKKSRRVGS